MSASELVTELSARFKDAVLGEQATQQNFPTLWIRPEATIELHRYLKDEIAQPFKMLVDLWAIDETARKHRAGQPPSGITIASHLLSHERNADIRIKTPLNAEYPRAKSIGGVFPNAAWYEREHKGLGVRFPPTKERFERLEETLRIALQMWSGKVAPFHGRHYRLAETLCHPMPLSRPHPPILIGGMGEQKTLRMRCKFDCMH